MWPFSSNETIKDSGLLSGFTDWHCHLLPGVDDGVKEKQESLRILDLWQEHGVKQVWLTPHTMDDFPNEPTELQTLFGKLKTEYKGNIELHLASEHMMDSLTGVWRSKMSCLWARARPTCSWKHPISARPSAWTASSMR